MSIGHVRDLGNGSSSPKTFSANFEYTGEIQKYTVPKSGLYKLEVWGGQGGGYVNETKDYGGKGGYSAGHKYFNKGTVLYVACGGYGETSRSGISADSFNGGGHCGRCTSGDGVQYLGAGGGATHIALVDGILSDIGETSFLEQGLLIAGGGGGGSYFSSKTAQGLSGGLTDNLTSTFGQGASYTYEQHNRAGGGGGYYGGNGDSSNVFRAYGGSSFIGNVPTVTYKGISYSPTKTAGVNTGAGKAIITFITS